MADTLVLLCPKCSDGKVEPAAKGPEGETIFNCTSCKLASTFDEVMEHTLKVSGASMTEMQMGAAQVHEMFTGYLEAGFTDKQALYLVGVLLTGNPGIAPRPA